MVYVVWSLLGFLSFIKKNNKFVTFLVALFILCIFCFNTDNPDLENYIAAYYRGYGVLMSEPLFNKLIAFSKDYISFEWFRFFVVLVGLALMIDTIYKYSPYPTFVLFLYTIYPMTIDVVQFRFFIGYSIALFAVRYLIDYQNNKKLKSIVLYFLLILLATGFHYGCILYSVLGILFFDFNKHKLLFFVIFPLIGIITISMIEKFAPYISLVIGAEKTQDWIRNLNTASGLANVKYIIRCTMLLLFSGLISYVNRNRQFDAAFVKKIPSGIGIFLKQLPIVFANGYNKYYDLGVNKVLFYCVYYLSFCFLLEIKFASEYERLSRLSLILGAILISRQLFYLTNINRRIAFLFFLLLFVLYFIIRNYFAAAPVIGQDVLFIDYVFRRVMENNELFSIVF